MFSDDDLRSALTTRIPDLDADVERELARVLERAGSRARARRMTYAVGLVAATAVLALVLGRDWLPQAEAPEPAPPTDERAQVLTARGQYIEPVDLDPGRYRAQFTDAPAEGFPEVEIDVPAGWGHDGADALATGPGGDDATRRIHFVARILRTSSGQCPGRPAAPGRGPLGHAEALSSVPGTRATEPQPVTVEGHRGYFVRLEVPRSTAAFERCTGADAVLPFYLLPMGWMTIDSPGWTSMLWVLDIEGTPVLINASHGPDVTLAEVAELVEMVESISFTES